MLFPCLVAEAGATPYTPVSAEVEAYEPLIQKYAKQYDIPEYVELIKAVMMQESGGRGLDPMQGGGGAALTQGIPMSRTGYKTQSIPSSAAYRS